MKEACESCKFAFYLERLDYRDGGCKHEMMDGHICMAFQKERIAEWMVGIPLSEGKCECYTPYGKEVGE